MNWKIFSKEKPIATESGCWDGLRSSEILVGTMNGRLHIVRMYQGIIDGNEFCDFYDNNDFSIDNVIYWTEIDSPF